MGHSRDRARKTAVLLLGLSACADRGGPRTTPPPRIEPAARLARDAPQERALDPSSTHRFTVAMAAGEVVRLGRPALVWAHNAHVAHAVSRTGDDAPLGGLLRQVLGRDYAAVATSFQRGRFVAQLPGDGERLQEFELPPAAPGSIDGVLAAMELGDAVVTWAKNDTAALPQWLARPQPMYWVGGLFSTTLLPHEWTRSFRVTSEFDGLVFLGAVDTEPASRTPRAGQ